MEYYHWQAIAFIIALLTVAAIFGDNQEDDEDESKNCTKKTTKE
jgi:hypothetical protein